MVGRLAIVRDPDATSSSDGTEPASTLNAPAFLLVTAETRGFAGSLFGLVESGFVVEGPDGTAADDDPVSSPKTLGLCRFLEDAREVDVGGDGGPAEMERLEGRDARGRDEPASATRGKGFAEGVDDDDPGDDAVEWSNPLVGGTTKDAFPGPTSEERDIGELVPSLTPLGSRMEAGGRGWKWEEEEGEAGAVEFER